MVFAMIDFHNSLGSVDETVSEMEGKVAIWAILKLDFIEGISWVSCIIWDGVDAKREGECFHLAFILRGNAENGTLPTLFGDSSLIDPLAGYFWFDGKCWALWPITIVIIKWRPKVWRKGQT